MGDSRRLNARQIFHPIEQRIGKGGLLLGLRVFRLGQRKTKQGGVFRIETRIDMRKLHETAGEQSRAAEQDESKGDFDDDEGAAEPAARAAFGRAACTLLQSLVHISARGEPGRSDAEDETGDNAEREREKEHAGIEMNLRDARQSSGRESQQSVEPPAGQNDAGHSAANRQHDALGEELADQSRTPGAERGEWRFPGNAPSHGRAEGSRDSRRQ